MKVQESVQEDGGEKDRRTSLGSTFSHVYVYGEDGAALHLHSYKIILA